jgi:S-DNA-T family DNA segregation ATPase FtsK/SpoIIIE
VNELGDLVNGLRSTAARIQEASAKLEKETAVRKAALTRQGDSELEKLLAEQKARRDEIKGTASARLANLEKRTAARKIRITKAHATSRKRSLERIDEVEGRRKFSVQKGILDTEKGREQRIAELDGNWAAYQQESANFQYQAAQVRESARKSFRAYPTFPKLLRETAASDGVSTKDQSELLRQAEASLRSYRTRVLPELFRFVPIWLWWAIAIGLFVVGPARIGMSGFSEAEFRQLVGVGIGLVTVLYFIGWGLGAGPARTTAKYLRGAEEAGARALQETEQRYMHESEQTRSDAANKIQALQQEWESAVSEAAEARKKNDGRMEVKMQRALQRNEQLYIRWRREAEEDLNAANEGRNAEDEAATTKLKAQWQGRIQQLESEYQTQRSELQREWEEVTGPAMKKIAEARMFADAQFAPWSGDTKYAAAETSLNVVKFGGAKITVASPLEAGKSVEVKAPLMLSLPNEGSILIESDEAGREKAIEALNNIVYRVLQTVPPGKAAFTLIDPVRLGQSFSSIMHLADFEENIVNRRIWTEPAEIEERLLELNSHMEKVIQMYLRNEFRDIVEYNREAGRIAEKYHFLVVADFPANFTETAMRRLVKIAASGARCGVFLLMQWDKRHAFIPGFEGTDFTANSIHLVANRNGIVAPKFAGREVTLELDRPPEPEVATRFLQEVGEASRGSNTVQVPFAQIAPEPDKRWSLQTTEELRVPIGRSGATKLQYFTLGKGTRQHVLIAGKTGSGKSTLLHVLVTNLALWSSPDQVEFYLVDFKKGVEFKDYAVAQLAHARVIAIESDREFGLSVLRRVDEELRTRGELFRAVGAQDLAGYKRASRNGRMPRVLLIIDEFQELFVEDDAISQNAALLLDRIVRQGRAFGIHVVLGSQTLGGAYSLARSTLGQMAVRIALQTNEADAYLIMDENNPAPRLLSRPGEGIYNDSGGTIEANSPFQVVWLPESERREALQDVRKLAEAAGERNEPIVFEGNSLADIGGNGELRDLLEGKAEAVSSARGATVWLGLPNEIKGPTRVVLDDRTGRNLLIAGQHEDHARALLAAAVLSLAAQNEPRNVRFVLVETQSGGNYVSLAAVAARIPHTSEIVKAGDLPDVVHRLVEEIDRREAGETGPKIYVVIQNLPAFKALRPDDEFSISFEEGKSNPAADFQRVYTDGPVHGIHVIAHVDGFNNANRFLGRKGLKEFSARVLFQMSASDSASFADDPRAGNLGLSRALLYDEHEGTYETFRPYARPNAGWLTEAEEKLRRRYNGGAGLPAGERDVANTRIKPG